MAANVGHEHIGLAAALTTDTSHRSFPFCFREPNPVLEESWGWTAIRGVRWVTRASWRLGLVRCLLFQSLPILKSTFTVVFGPDLTPWPLSAVWEEGHVGVGNSERT